MQYARKHATCSINRLQNLRSLLNIRLLACNLEQLIGQETSHVLWNNHIPFANLSIIDMRAGQGISQLCTRPWRCQFSSILIKLGV